MIKIIDSHTHVFSEEVCAHRENYYHDKSFESLYGNTKARLAGYEELVDSMNSYNIDTSFLLSFPWKMESDSERENEYLLKAVHAQPERFVAFGSVSMGGPGDIKNRIRALSRNGFIGIGEIAFYEKGFGKEQKKYLSHVMEGCGEVGMSVVVHVNEPVGHTYKGKYCTDFNDLYAIIRSFPQVSCILSHWGGGIFIYELMKEVKKSFSNILYDTAASPLVYGDEIYKIAIDCIGSEKIIFGTDFPLLSPKRYLDVITKMSLTARDDILYRNAEKQMRKTELDNSQRLK